MHLSIVIPAFNESLRLAQTLEQVRSALAGGGGEHSWEIIVCDNNSGDDTAAIASRLRARVAFEPVNQISRARNTGATLASGQWLLFMDADTWPPAGLMSEVFEVIDQNGRYIGCGSTVEVRDGTRFNRLRLERMNPLFRALGVAGGAFLLCRREAFHAIGGFSVNLYALEDIEFVLRLRKYGRSTGRAFRILHRHPAVTSGRKGEYRLGAMFRLILSNVVALVLFALHYVLPGRWVGKLGAKWLPYWYGDRERSGR